MSSEPHGASLDNDRPTTEVVRLEPGSEPVSGYRLEKLLGRGGFGEVWKVAGPGGIAVAMKFIRPEGKSGVELRALELMKDIRHAHLLSLFGIWKKDPYVIIAMELADGSLLDRLNDAVAQGQPGIPFPELIEWMSEAAKAIDFLNEPRHSHDGKTGLSIQHRDVKPHNLLLVGTTLKLADFGLVRLLERQVTSHTGAMTPTYAAPEFFRGETSSQSDQYGLAVTYCQLRGGRLPFDGTLEQIMMGHAKQAPDLTMLPEAEQAVVTRALAKQPGDRWPSCRAFVQALAATVSGHMTPQLVLGTVLPATPAPGAFLAADPTTQALPQFVLTVLPVRPRQRWPWALAILSLLLVSVGGALVLLHRPSPSAEPSEQSQIAKSSATQPAVLPTLRSEPRGLTDVAFSPDGQRIVSVGDDAVVWQWQEPPPPAPDRKQAPTAPQALVLVPILVHRLEAAANPRLSPDGCRFLTDTALGVQLWDVDTGKVLRSIQFEQQNPFVVRECRVDSKAFAPNGRRLIVGYSPADRFWDSNYYVQVWDLELNAQPKPFTGHKQPVSCAAVTGAGDRAVSAGKDGVRLWAVAKGSELHHINRASVLSLAFSPDGSKVLIGEELNTLLLIDADTGQELRRLAGHTSGVQCVTFSADGKRALSGGRDRTARLWDVETGKLLTTFRGPADTVVRVAFAPDGFHAIAGSKDGTVRQWKIPP